MPPDVHFEQVCLLEGPTSQRWPRVLSYQPEDFMTWASTFAHCHLALRSPSRANFPLEGTILHGVSLPKSKETFAKLNWPTVRSDFWFCVPHENGYPFCDARDWNPFTATRVGEAFAG